MLLNTIIVAGGCAVERQGTPEVPTYASDVAPILSRRCEPCHSGQTPAAGWKTTTFLETIGCVPSGAAAASPADANAPLVRVLSTDDHRRLLPDGEKAVLLSWIAGGASAFRGVVHPAGIVDPRSPAWHGKFLRERRWAPMLDEKNQEACGRCHDGAPARPAGIVLAAPGATACTNCHAEPAGVLACSTCHGSTPRSYPPRDPCFFPEGRAKAGAHAAHVEPSSTHPAMECATCHPAPGNDVIA